jgi:hypothetical protein
MRMRKRNEGWQYEAKHAFTNADASTSRFVLVYTTINFFANT